MVSGSRALLWSSCLVIRMVITLGLSLRLLMWSSVELIMATAFQSQPRALRRSCALCRCSLITVPAPDGSGGVGADCAHSARPLHPPPCFLQLCPTGHLGRVRPSIASREFHQVQLLRACGGGGRAGHRHLPTRAQALQVSGTAPTEPGRRNTSHAADLHIDAVPAVKMNFESSTRVATSHGTASVLVAYRAAAVKPLLCKESALLGDSSSHCPSWRCSF